MPGEDVLKVDEAAVELRCSIDSVYRMVRSGELHAFRVGKRGIRVTRRAIEDYKAGNTTQSAVAS